MKYITLSNGNKTKVNDEDFEKFGKMRWRQGNRPSGNYARTSKWNSKTKKTISYALHRLILGLKNGDGKIVDHKNGNELDNRKINLRICTQS